MATFSAGLVLAVPLAWASHLFTDVPDSNPFHDDITAVKEAGITGGKTCTPPGTPPTYCPSEPITREAMAAFVHRGLARVGRGSGNNVQIPLNTQGAAQVAVVTIKVPGVAGGTQFVAVVGELIAVWNGTGTCPCLVNYNIVQDGVGGIGFGTVTLDSIVDPGSLNLGIQTGVVLALVPVPAGSTQTFRLIAARQGGTGNVGIQGNGSLGAITAPFGAMGTSSLGATSSPESPSPDRDTVRWSKGGAPTSGR